MKISFTQFFLQKVDDWIAHFFIFLREKKEAQT